MLRGCSNGWRSLFWHADILTLKRFPRNFATRSQELLCFFSFPKTDLSPGLFLGSHSPLAFNKFFPFVSEVTPSYFVAWTQWFLTEITGNILLSNMKSLRPRLAWPKWTFCSFSNHADREMPINELMKLSNNFRQLLFSLPKPWLESFICLQLRRTLPWRWDPWRTWGESSQYSDLRKTLQTDSNWYHCKIQPHWKVKQN